MISKYELPNFMHIILNNGAHESVGGQPSAGMDVDFTRIAQEQVITIGHFVATRKKL